MFRRRTVRGVAARYDPCVARARDAQEAAQLMTNSRGSGDASGGNISEPFESAVLSAGSLMGLERMPPPKRCSGAW